MSNVPPIRPTADPFAGLPELARRHGEVAAASHKVITARLELAASPNVMTPAGQAEMARMVPEKVHAMAHSGSEAIFHLNAMLLEAGSAWLREVNAAGAATAAMLTASSPAAMLRTQQDYVAGLITRMTEAGNAMVVATTALQSAALAPVHRTVTSNARRLKR